MIRGAVNARDQAVVRLRVRGPTGAETDIDAMVDTGFNGSLTLPDGVIATLGLARVSGGQALLADGSVRQVEIYAAEVEWVSGWVPVLVSTVGDEPVVGMHLMAGHELRIDVVRGGAVKITQLP
jgi:clan AA aspartic protease